MVGLFFFFFIVVFFLLNAEFSFDSTSQTKCHNQEKENEIVFDSHPNLFPKLFLFPAPPPFIVFDRVE